MAASSPLNSGQGDQARRPAAIFPVSQEPLAHPSATAKIAWPWANKYLEPKIGTRLDTPRLKLCDRPSEVLAYQTLRAAAEQIDPWPFHRGSANRVD
jgi:hypothetical protein